MHPAHQACPQEWCVSEWRGTTAGILHVYAATQHTDMSGENSLGEGEEWAGGVGDVSNACSAQNKCKTQENTEKIWQKKHDSLSVQWKKKFIYEWLFTWMFICVVI